MCRSTLEYWRRCNDLFKLNSRITLVRSSSDMFVHCAREISPKDLSSTPPKDHPLGPQILPQSPLAVTTLVKRPLGPTLRDNNFPEVTDLFFRLNLFTFVYQLEAANLEYLMRLLVRLEVWISQSSGFQGTPRAHQNSQKLAAFPKATYLSPVNPIIGIVH